MDPGQGKNKVNEGPCFEKTSSDWKATATNQMHSSDLEASGKKCCYFWFHSDVKFLTSFDSLLYFVIFSLFFMQ